MKYENNFTLHNSHFNLFLQTGGKRTNFCLLFLFYFESLWKEEV